MTIAAGAGEGPSSGDDLGPHEQAAGLDEHRSDVTEAVWSGDDPDDPS